MSKCVKCGKETKQGLTVDIDIRPIPACKNCEEDVKLALIIIGSGDKDMARGFMKDWFSPLIK